MLINFIKSIGVDNACGTRNNFKVASYLVVVLFYFILTPQKQRYLFGMLRAHCGKLCLS